MLGILSFFEIKFLCLYTRGHANLDRISDALASPRRKIGLENAYGGNLGFCPRVPVHKSRYKERTKHYTAAIQ